MKVVGAKGVVSLCPTRHVFRRWVLFHSGLVGMANGGVGEGRQAREGAKSLNGGISGTGRNGGVISDKGFQILG